MKKERKRKSKKELLLLEILGVVFFLLAFVAIVIAAILQDDGFEPNFFVIAGTALTLWILAISLELFALEDEMFWEIQKQHDRYSKQSLTILQDLDRERINAAFQNAGFRKENGVWHKRQFSWAKLGCMIHYYARCVSEGESMAWLETLGTRKMTSKNMCVFVFQCYEQITPEDETTLQERAINFITEEVLLHRATVHTCIPVLVDEVDGEGRFLEQSKGVTVYAYGCKLLKQLFL